MRTLQELMSVLPQRGRIEWIGLRPARHADLAVVERAMARTGVGLEGDRYGKAGGKRQVTLIQGEHLDALAGLLSVEEIRPELLRRNLVVRGLNLLALKGRKFRVGEAVLEWTGACHPCSRMETILGRGGYNAMRGHGGITARVVEDGELAVGSPVTGVADSDVNQRL